MLLSVSHGLKTKPIFTKSSLMYKCMLVSLHLLFNSSLCVQFLFLFAVLFSHAFCLTKARLPNMCTYLY